jgi:hypothetical protein
MIGGGIGSRRLWSLWEIMLDFDAASLFRACSSMTSMAQLPPGGHLSATMYQILVDVLDRARAELERLEAPAALAIANRMKVAVGNAIEDERGYKFGNEDWIILRDNAGKFASCVTDELSGRHFFSMTPREARLWGQPEPPFGADVQVKYPSALFEIDEASKCLALGRGTACVFHLMRTMEIGILATARCLGIPDPTKPAERNWGYSSSVMSASDYAMRSLPIVH